MNPKWVNARDQWEWPTTPDPPDLHLRALMIIITLTDMVWGLDEAGPQLSLHPQKEALDPPRIETE